ncbi:MAG: DUF1573 domain-containing protein [Chlorobi bacterium]|nr:DUF1573 domain-containing protein [Chlorobiota bacterium]
MRLSTLFLAMLIIIACKHQQTNNPVHFPLSEEGYDPTAPQPKIELSDTVINLGNINPDTIYKIPVVVTNVGEEPLIIKRAFSDCGCIVSDVPQNPISPGKSDTLIIQLNTAEIPLTAKQRVVTIVSNTVPNSQTVVVYFNMNSE